MPILIKRNLVVLTLFSLELYIFLAIYNVATTKKPAEVPKSEDEHQPAGPVSFTIIIINKYKVIMYIITIFVIQELKLCSAKKKLLCSVIIVIKT